MSMRNTGSAAAGPLALALLTMTVLAVAPARADGQKSKAAYGDEKAKAAYGEEKSEAAGGMTAAERAQLEATAQSPKKFVETVGAGGLLEVELGKLAAEKAQSQQVKDFAQMLATDHSKANQKLEQISRGNGIAPPTELPADKKAKFDRLSSLSGAQFDREYMKMMVDGHRRNVDLFREAAKSTALGGDLREFASETLPKLQSHLEMAQKIAVSVG